MAESTDFFQVADWVMAANLDEVLKFAAAEELGLDILAGKNCDSTLFSCNTRDTS